jgi:hypothetical protein
MSTPPREIRGARVIRYAGDPSWSEPWHEQREVGDVSVGTTVVALAVVDYGFDPYDDHYILRLHVEGWASDDNPGDRASAIDAFNEEISELGLAEIPMLPPPWNDVRGDAPLEARLSVLLRDELGENHAYPWGVKCAATCGACEAALCEVGRTDWAVVNSLTWTGQQSESRRPRIEAWGTWEHVRGSVDRHTARSH